MTIERTLFVRIPTIVAEPILALDRRAIAALQRAEKLPPGDRSEVLRFASIHSVIDQLAVTAMTNGEPTAYGTGVNIDSAHGTTVMHISKSSHVDGLGEVSEWLRDGAVVVGLQLPHFRGTADIGGAIGAGPVSPASRWASAASDSNTAIHERFESRLLEALSEADIELGALYPSDISNVALTECLRRYAEKDATRARIDLRVVYRDGSEGPRFPLHALEMTTIEPEGHRVLRVSLMSIRHVGMDTIVDGAWLRNSKVSNSRPAGETDAIVFETSLRQLRRLADGGPTFIHMHQTGFAPAIIGFYRALVCHLLERPVSVAVVPRYYRGGSAFDSGTLWRTP